VQLLHRFGPGGRCCPPQRRISVALLPAGRLHRASGRFGRAERPLVATRDEGSAAGIRHRPPRFDKRDVSDKPRFIRIAPDGSIWVTDASSRIQEWNSSLVFVRAVGKEGTGGG